LNDPSVLRVHLHKVVSLAKLPVAVVKSWRHCTSKQTIGPIAVQGSGKPCACFNDYLEFPLPADFGLGQPSIFVNCVECDCAACIVMPYFVGLDPVECRKIISCKHVIDCSSDAARPFVSFNVYCCL